MRRWLRSLAAALVTSGLGVAINLATDLKDAWWAWTLVAALTIAVSGFTAMAHPTSASRQNSITGTVSGHAVQAGDIHGSVTLSGERIPSDPDQRPSK
jgi:hypothetical protein